VALVRPFWFVHQVSGITAGLWYYNLLEERLLSVRHGDLRHELARALPEPTLGETAAAVCFMVAQFKPMLQRTSPDVYRLAHIEAGMAGHRLYLAATAMQLGCCAIGAFYDDEVHQLLGISQPGWEVIYGTAVGVPAIIPAT
jgi:SagB-type dehydrogenase family enzyme